ncbi:uncharacterized protein EI90DRAFT_3136308 [Cantharellus anzutake]|uniref:uncharacterized protein n=1 Tax=Cantharellus anzutake TaxID=1750568 RepID=UPI001903A2E1|nr:uncharacterized protein EI90DRAFT_3136308 [Cantharellus anzutake]KAF8313937.1 hypothetical protein EI90DRAFT_3136308 [Cantharellus anzutake]
MESLIWDDSWVPTELSKIISYFQGHSTIPIPPLSGLPLEAIQSCRSGIENWIEYRETLTKNEEKKQAGISPTSTSLSSSHRFRVLPARRMFQGVFFGLLQTRLALMWTQYSSNFPAYPNPVEIPSRPQRVHGHKREIQYWVQQCRLALLDYTPAGQESGFIAEITHQPHEADGSVLPTSLLAGDANRLLNKAKSFETLAGQCRLGANILYAAWGLRQILELGSECLHEHIQWTKDENSPFITLALAVCVSPLVLLMDTTMNRAGTVPTWTSLASHVCQGAPFPSISGGEVVMENAILQVVVSVCERGGLAVQDLYILNHAWTYLNHNTSSPQAPPPDVDRMQEDGVDLQKRKRTRSQHSVGHSDGYKAQATRASKRRKGKKKAMAEDESMEDGTAAAVTKGSTSRGGDDDWRKFIAEFAVPDLDDINDWPELVVPDSTSRVPNSTPHPSSSHHSTEKVLYSFTFSCVSTNDGMTCEWNEETFQFPSKPDSEPILVLNRLVSSVAWDSTWSPHAMVEAEALTMSPEDFQSLVNNLGLLVLVGLPSDTVLDRSLLLSRLSKTAHVQCFNSDSSRSGEDDEQSWEPLPQVIDELTDWRTSRPLVVHHLKGVVRLPVESLLNSLDGLLFEYLDERGGDLPEDYNSWRTPMLATVGSFTAPHLDEDGVGTVLHCIAGYKLIFFPIELEVPLIVKYDDLDTQGSIGFEYLFHSPNRFGCFILCPGQTLIMAPGQVHFVFTVSKEDKGELSVGALMQGSFFLSPRCMVRSLHASWVDRLLQSQRGGPMDRCDTMTAMLEAYVLDSHRRLTSGCSLVGQPEPKEVLAAMFMALVYSKETEVDRGARCVIHHYARLHPEDFSQFRREFSKVRAANLQDGGDMFTAEDVESLRGSMKAAVQAMMDEGILE